MDGKERKIHIYYDGRCNLCSGIVGAIAKSGKHDTFESIPAQRGLPDGVVEKEAMHDVHVVDQNGRLYKGADAVFRVFDEYPLLRPLAMVGRLPIIRQCSQALYWAIARTRYWIFGRKKVSF